MLMLGLNETIGQMAMGNTDHWHGNMLRREDVHVTRKASHFDVECQRKKGRTKKKV